MAASFHKPDNVLFYKALPCRKPAMINEFSLQKTGEKATIQVLTQADLAQVMALHEEVRAALSDEQKMFLLPQNADYFEKFLSQKSGVMLGISAGGKLIAQLALMGPLSLDDISTRHSITRNDVTFHHVEPLDSVIAIKSMTVSPNYRGNELSQHILTAALELPLIKTADHAFAQISVENTRSWELFLKNGFGVVAAGIDPVDKKPRFILQKPAQNFSFDMAPSADDVSPTDDFSAIIRLTQRDALIGRIDDLVSSSANIRLAFSSIAELAASPPRFAGRLD
jgi:ribosomal protein S18 acetylase RimI-like enzyme